MPLVHCDNCDKGLQRPPSAISSHNFCSWRCRSLSPCYRSELAEATTKSWQNPAIRQSRQEAMERSIEAGHGSHGENAGYHHTEEARHRMSLAKKGKVPWNKGKHFGYKPHPWMEGNIPWNKGLKGFGADILRTPEWRSKISQSIALKWCESAYVAKQMQAFHVRPNKPEMLLTRLLERALPGEYKYVGDGQDEEFIIGGKCPDWGHINGHKKLIELFGDYWHKGEDPQEKIDHYKQYGFDTLVIWEHELPSEELVLSKIRRFNEN